MSLASVRQVLASICALPPIRRLCRYGLWLLGVLCLCFFLSVLAIRYFLLPHIDDYRGEIESALSKSSGLSVTIERINADWQGWRPHLSLRNVAIRNEKGVSAFSLNTIELVIGWQSLVHLAPRLHQLEIASPALAIRRDAQGRLFVAGLEVKNTGSASGSMDLILDPSQIIIRDARITWTDEQRAAPALILEHLNLRLDNRGTLHRFQLTAEPPQNLAKRIDIHGELRGRAVSDLSGQADSEFSSVDLAAWRTWVDYPVELSNGQGNAQIGFALLHSSLAAVSADLALSNLKATLGQDLPAMDLDSLAGKVKFTRLADGFEMEAQHIALQARDGVRIAPTDMRLRWQPLNAEFSTRSLDLENLPYLAARMPIDAGLRRRIAALAPVGRVENVKLGWRPEEVTLEHYRIAGNFLGLGLATQDPVVQISGLSGRIDGDENSGVVAIASTGLSVLHARHFRHELAFASLNAQVRWKRTGQALEIDLLSADFKNRDLTGIVKTRYVRQHPGELGHIDLEAKLSHLDAAAVWRYIPQQEDTHVSDWLHTALLGGESADTAIKFQGDLAKLPFINGSGVFTVTSTVHDGILLYAKDWPQVSNVNGKITLDGASLAIAAKSANLQGLAVSPVSVEIPELGAQDMTLLINGKAKGRTADFLKFIAASPLDKGLGRFTRDIAAQGGGELDLKLSIPLHHPERTQVAGSYRFDGHNQLLKAGLPPLDDIRGHFEFTDTTLLAPEIRARFLGNPTTFEIRTEADKSLAVKASGAVSIDQLQQSVPHPVFAYLSGQTNWSGSARFASKAGGATLRLSTDLRGISSSLPEPFAKSASDVMTTVLERKPQASAVAAGKTRSGMTATALDQLEVSLGKVLRAQFLLRSDSGKSKVERGAIALGDARLRYPEREGSMLTVNLPQVDADFWYRLLAGGPKKPAATARHEAAENPLNLKRFDLKLGEALAMGRVIHALNLSGTLQNAAWNVDLSSHEIKGKVDWSDAGFGRLTGRFSQFNLPAAAASQAPRSENSKKLPNIELDFERFVFAGKDFGEIKVSAVNEGNDWKANITGRNEDGTFNVSTKSRLRQGPPQTDMAVRLSIKNVENYLNRLGYPDVVRQGNAVLSGNFRWNDVPYAFDIPSLSGSFSFEAKEGRFNKLKPGVGRLLGLLSLQALPRRMALDFGDVFSAGFAFDSLAGQLDVSQGIMSTKKLNMLGPAAQVSLQGQLDLAKETQNVRVSVRPTFGDSVTAGVALANPVVGAAAWAFTKVLGNPMDKVLTFDYLVTGSLDDPKVEKLSRPFPFLGKEP